MPPDPLPRPAMHNVVYCFDANYQQHFAASLASLVSTYGGPPSSLRVHVVTDVDSELLRNFLRSFSDRTKISIDIKNIDKSAQFLIDKIPDRFINTNGYLNKAAYYRILIPELIEKNVDKVLYLDSDTIILKDISEIFDIDIGEYAASATLDVNSAEICKNRGFAEYYNSGVMVMNLKNWRREGVVGSCFEHIYDEKSDIVFADQCAINYVLSGKIKPLSNRWNRVVSNSISSQAQADDVLQSASIVHFVTAQKPWLLWYENRIGKVYIDSLKKSEWPNPILTPPKTVNEHRWMARKLFRQGKHADSMSAYETIINYLINKLDGPQQANEADG
jgi:lipopolysaccharide biosynthesis glycosyltransferase